MIKVISPKDYKTIPWKNGKGTTLELAINSGATLANFDWRLSIANVVEDGPFSDFAGYQRNLILIEGAGITLRYAGQDSDTLNQLLNIATFDGGWQTSGHLHAGPIKDFNLMYRKDIYQANVFTWATKRNRTIKPVPVLFIYSHSNDISVIDEQNNVDLKLPKRHLLLIGDHPNPVKISGAQVIAIELTPRD